MKLPRDTILVRTWRAQIQNQINALLDLLPQIDSDDQKGIITAEIVSLRQKIKPYDKADVIILSQKVTIQTITLNSLIDGKN